VKLNDFFKKREQDAAWEQHKRMVALDKAGFLRERPDPLLEKIKRGLAAANGKKR
jgi:hypothetical protein